MLAPDRSTLSLLVPRRSKSSASGLSHRCRFVPSGGGKEQGLSPTRSRVQHGRGHFASRPLAYERKRTRRLPHLACYVRRQAIGFRDESETPTSTRILGRCSPVLVLPWPHQNAPPSLRMPASPCLLHSASMASEKSERCLISAPTEGFDQPADAPFLPRVPLARRRSPSLASLTQRPLSASRSCDTAKYTSTPDLRPDSAPAPKGTSVSRAGFANSRRCSLA